MILAKKVVKLIWVKKFLAEPNKMTTHSTGVNILGKYSQNAFIPIKSRFCNLMIQTSTQNLGMENTTGN